MHLEWSINLGNIIAAGAFLITIISLHRKNTIKFARLEHKVNLMWNAFKKRFHLDDHGDDEDLGY